MRCRSFFCARMGKIGICNYKWVSIFTKKVFTIKKDYFYCSVQENRNHCRRKSFPSLLSYSSRTLYLLQRPSVGASFVHDNVQLCPAYSQLNSEILQSNEPSQDQIPSSDTNLPDNVRTHSSTVTFHRSIVLLVDLANSNSEEYVQVLTFSQQTCPSGTRHRQ